MKTLKIYRNKKSCISELIYSIAFDVYLKISGMKFNAEESYKNNVYDNYGIIDTLGNQGSDGKYTFSYSDELVYLFGFKIFNLSIEFID